MLMQDGNPKWAGVQDDQVLATPISEIVVLRQAKVCRVAGDTSTTARIWCTALVSEDSDLHQIKPDCAGEVLGRDRAQRDPVRSGRMRGGRTEHRA
jgi:hypothetical protein